MNTRVKQCSLSLLTILIAIGIVAMSGTSFAASVTVDAKSNIFGAGHSAPPAPGGVGPGILPPVHYFAAGSGQVLTFSSVTGSKSYNGGQSWWGPEGYDPWLYGVNFPSYGGISGIITSSYQFLAGIFLDDTEPADPAPSSLDFGPDGLTRNFTEVYPAIGQLFFIGDGMTDSAEIQKFHVPPTATRVFFGFIDTDASYLPGLYHDNLGSLTATFDVSPEPPPPVLVGYWSFDEGNGITANDSSGFSNQGAIEGAAWVSGKCGNAALSFDGGSGGGIDYVVVPNSPSIDTSEFTVSCWVSLAGVTRNNVILDKRNGQWDRNLGLYYYVNESPLSEPTGNYLAILIGDGSAVNWYEYAAYYLTTPNQDQFFHIAATHHHFDGHSYLRLYLNGEMVDERELPKITGNVGGGDLYIGTHGYPQLDSSPTKGIIDEVRIYNYALTQEQIQADMEACTPPPPTLEERVDALQSRVDNLEEELNYLKGMESRVYTLEDQLNNLMEAIRECPTTKHCLDEKKGK